MIMYEGGHFGEKRHLACYHFSDIDVAAHLHRSYELVYVENGALEVERDGISFVVKQGELMLLLPYEIHRYQSSGASCCCVAVFSPDYLHEFSAAAEKMTLENPVFTLKPSMAEWMYGALFVPEPNPYITKAFLYYAVGSLEQKSRLVERKKASTDLLHQILMYIQENYRKPICLEDMALVLGYSRIYLSRYLNKRLSCSFTDLLNRHRVSFGAYLLKHTDESISTIAFSCGYTSIRSFNRNFKALEGMTPKECRRQAGEHPYASFPDFIPEEER